MFKISFNPNEPKRIIKPEDLLPKTVENTRGELHPFKADNIIESLIEETGLDRPQAIKVTTNVLRKISSLGLEFIAAPHLRELVCGELTGAALHTYRNQYTRLGIPIFDIKNMLKSQEAIPEENGFDPLYAYLWFASQIVEQYVHLDELNGPATHLSDRITKDAEKLADTQKKEILESLQNSLTLLHEKQAGLKGPKPE